MMNPHCLRKGSEKVLQANKVHMVEKVVCQEFFMCDLTPIVEPKAVD